jgi:hypothetical protein
LSFACGLAVRESRAIRYTGERTMTIAGRLDEGLEIIPVDANNTEKPFVVA